MSRLRLLLVILVTAASAVALAACGSGNGGSDDGSGQEAGSGSGGDSGGADATASGEEPCDLSGKETSFGVSYQTSIRVIGEECSQAEKVMTEFHKCRQAAGGDEGQCNKPVLGYDCIEKREGVPDVQFRSDVTCTSGEKQILASYSQNL